MRTRTALSAALGSSLLLAGAAFARQAPLDIPGLPAGAEVIRLWPGPAPGSEAWTGREQVIPQGQMGAGAIRNVVTPTLTVFRPPAGKADGSAVIVAPGGGFYFLSIDSEGQDVARWLAERGVTCFVLRYRLHPSPEADGAFAAEVQAYLAKLLTSPDPDAAAREIEVGPSFPAVQDGLQAIRLVRRRAAEWGVDPKRIGMLGFSAGGAVAIYSALSPDPESRPDFVGSLYAGLATPPPAPADAPPLFAAVAADDQLHMDRAVSLLVQSWRSAHRPAELHVYERGGHGFGLVGRGTTSDHWIDAFAWWMQANGWMRRPG